MMSKNVAIAVLARWLGINGVAVRDLARRGIVVKVGRGSYALEDSVRRALAHYRDIASDKGGAASLADIRQQWIRLVPVFRSRAGCNGLGCRR